MRENNFLGPDVDIPRLAAMTKNYSGAEIEAVVKSASSFAFFGNIDITKNAVKPKTNFENMKVCMSHFEQALHEVSLHCASLSCFSLLTFHFVSCVVV